MHDPWGVGDPPAVEPTEVGPLPPRLAGLAELAQLRGRRPLAAEERWVFPAADELPEVKALVAQGWRPLDSNPLWCCLPAVWPIEHRCWVPDRRPRIKLCAASGGAWLEPVDEEELEDQQLDLEGDAEQAGLPAPPAGRLWLLRSPWSTLDLDTIRAMITRRIHERGDDLRAATVVTATRELLTWSEEQVLTWQHADDVASPDEPAAQASPAADEQLLQWRDAGFADDEPSALVRAGPQLAPGEATAFIDAGLTEQERPAWVAWGFSPSEARAWRDLDVLPQEARVWRSVGRGPAQAAQELAQRPTAPPAGEPRLPAGVEVGWVGYGSSRSARQYAVSDPPGTRGRVAWERD